MFEPEVARIFLKMRYGCPLGFISHNIFHDVHIFRIPLINTHCNTPVKILRVHESTYEDQDPYCVSIIFRNDRGLIQTSFLIKYLLL